MDECNHIDLNTTVKEIENYRHLAPLMGPKHKWPI